MASKTETKELSKKCNAYLDLHSCFLFMLLLFYVQSLKQDKIITIKIVNFFFRMRITGRSRAKLGIMPCLNSKTETPIPNSGHVSKKNNFPSKADSVCG